MDMEWWEDYKDYCPSKSVWGGIIIDTSDSKSSSSLESDVENGRDGLEEIQFSSVSRNATCDLKYTANSIKVDIDNCHMCNTSDKRMMEIITVLHANVKDITLNTIVVISQSH